MCKHRVDQNLMVLNVYSNKILKQNKINRLICDSERFTEFKFDAKNVKIVKSTT